MKIVMARMIAKVFQGVNARYKTLRNQHLRINLVSTKLFPHQGRCPLLPFIEQGAVHDPSAAAP